MKNLVSSYTRLACDVHSGEVRGEVGIRSRMCCVGWVVWVHGFLYFCLYAILVGSIKGTVAERRYTTSEELRRAVENACNIITQ